MTVREIERELARLRDASTEPGAPPRLRTSVMTHLAWVPERWVGQATETLAGLAERHPSRTILLFPRPDDRPDRLDHRDRGARLGPAGELDELQGVVVVRSALRY